jgi:multimeric flavodoxin WrbA
MQILGIVGSMRKNKNTAVLVNQIIKDMKEINTEITSDIIYTVDKTLNPCKVICSGYCSKHAYQCSTSDDVMDILQQMIKADALVIGTPLYFRSPPVKFQALIERLISIFFYYEAQGDKKITSPLQGKPCGLVAVTEYSNPHIMLEYLHDFCTVLGMKPVILDKFPYLGVAGQGDITKNSVFNPFDRSKDLAHALLNELSQLPH